MWKRPTLRDLVFRSLSRSAARHTHCNSYDSILSAFQRGKARVANVCGIQVDPSKNLTAPGENGAICLRIIKFIALRTTLVDASVRLTSNVNASSAYISRVTRSRSYFRRVRPLEVGEERSLRSRDSGRERLNDLGYLQSGRVASRRVALLRRGNFSVARRTLKPSRNSQGKGESRARLHRGMRVIAFESVVREPTLVIRASNHRPSARYAFHLRYPRFALK